MKKILLNLFAFSTSKFRRLLQPQSIVTSVSIFVIFTLVVDFSENKNQRISNSKSKQLLNWIPSINDSSNDANDRIFFHETSGRMELSFKESCVVESAALHNPQRPVQIFFQPQQQHEPSAVTIDQSSAWFQVLSQYENVQVIVIDDEELYFKNSPLDDWYKKGEWRDSPYRLQHMSDYIRMVSLKKQGGGMYLDLDVLTLKPYTSPLLRNFVTVKLEQFSRITNAVMHFDFGHRLISATIKAQAEDYDPNDYLYNGPGALTEVIAELCQLRGGMFNLSCSDVHLLPPNYFHSTEMISSINDNVLLHDIFQRTDEVGVADYLRYIRETNYGVHFHNSYSKDSLIDLNLNSTQVFSLLASENCPLTFRQGVFNSSLFFAI